MVQKSLQEHLSLKTVACLTFSGSLKHFCLLWFFRISPFWGTAPAHHPSGAAQPGLPEKPSPTPLSYNSTNPRLQLLKSLAFAVTAQQQFLIEDMIITRNYLLAYDCLLLDCVTGIDAALDKGWVSIYETSKLAFLGGYLSLLGGGLCTQPSSLLAKTQSCRDTQLILNASSTNYTGTYLNTLEPTMIRTGWSAPW